MKNNSPQLENGHIKINNENAEAFAKLHLSGNEWKILWVVLRKTWGWNKKEDQISLTQFQKATNLSRPSVSEAILKMVGKKVLLLNKDNHINLYSFNKDYTSWLNGREKGTNQARVIRKLISNGRENPNSREIGTTLVGKKVPKMVGKKVHTKDNKDNIQKTYTCHNSLMPCNEYCIWDIGMELDVHKGYVNETFEDLKAYIEDHPRKYKNFHKTLANWVRMNLRKGYFHSMTEMERIDMPSEHPDAIKRSKEIRKMAVEKGIL